MRSLTIFLFLTISISVYSQDYNTAYIKIAKTCGVEIVKNINNNKAKIKK